MRISRQEIFSDKRYEQLMDKTMRELVEEFNKEEARLIFLDETSYYAALNELESWYDKQFAARERAIDRRTLFKIELVKGSYSASYRSPFAARAAAKLLGAELY